jgi:hypothetical protein
MLTAIRPDLPPYSAQIDSIHDRLYILVSSGDGTAEMRIHDLSDPEAPEEIGRFAPPLSHAWDIDPVRQLMFIVDAGSKAISVYDLADDDPQLVEGSPFDPTVDYPGENTWAFGVRNLIVDPWSNRIFAARPQGALTELMAWSYDGFIPGEGARYTDGADATTMESIPDGVDVSVPVSERVNIIDGYTPLPDSNTGQVMYLVGSHDGTTLLGALIPFGADLEMDPGCEGEDSPRCWMQPYRDGEARPALLTEGAACLDPTHQVVSTSVYLYESDSPSEVLFHRYDAAGNVSPWVPSDGDSPPGPALGIAMVCH